MKINEDCIRDILKYLVENLNITINMYNLYTYNPITVFDLISNLKNSFDISDIIYSINILFECNFIEGDRDNKKINVNAVMQNIYNVTYRGHKFYESIKPEPIWNKTKNVVNKVGVHTLDFIENIAHDVAVESAKQFVNITMGQTN